VNQNMTVRGRYEKNSIAGQSPYLFDTPYVYLPFTILDNVNTSLLIVGEEYVFSGILKFGTITSEQGSEIGGIYLEVSKIQ